MKLIDEKPLPGAAILNGAFLSSNLNGRLLNFLDLVRKLCYLSTYVNRKIA